MEKNEKIAELYRIVAGLESAEECELFFEDLCTKKEVEKMAERLYAAKLLMEGKTERVVAVNNNQLMDYDIDEALAMKKPFKKKMFDMSGEISI